MVEVALEDRVMAKMYGRVVFKFMNKILEVRFLFFICAVLTCFSRRTARNGGKR